MGMNQKEAVFQAVINVVGVQHEGVKYEPTKEQRAQISMVLIEGFKSGDINLDREFDETGLKSYVSGLLSNWLRKDTRLNGGTKYEAQNPGSRAGVADPQLKAMRALLTTLTDDADRAEVQKHIDARVAEINKAKAPTIDFSKLPPELANKFHKQ